MEENINDILKKLGDELIKENQDEDIEEILIGCSDPNHNNKKWKGPYNLY